MIWKQSQKVNATIKRGIHLTHYLKNISFNIYWSKNAIIFLSKLFECFCKKSNIYASSNVSDSFNLKI